MTPRSCCALCGHGSPRPIHRSLGAPVFQNKLHATFADARACATGDIDLVGCERCGFVWNRSFDPALVDYDGRYENDQSHSPTFQAHLRGLVAEMFGAFPPAEALHVLEVGCGQGYFLDYLAREAGERIHSAHGFDPAWRGNDGERRGGARLFRRRFDAAGAALLDEQPNLIVSRHTIEHLVDPVRFLTDIVSALEPRRSARLFVETPCVEWILRNEALQDIFYEHCSLFDAHSLEFAMRRAALQGVSVSHVFGGQYLLACGSFAAAQDACEPKASDLAPLFDVFAERAAAFVEHWRAFLARAATQGRVAVWGGAAKGVTFALLTDRERELIDCLIDINPGKQGSFVPVSGHAIVSPEQAVERKVRTLVLVNPIYRAEVDQQCRALGLDARIAVLE